MATTPWTGGISCWPPQPRAGAGLALGAKPIRAANLASNEVRVAIIGAGAQGQVLLDASLQIPNVRFVAVCDIWTEYNQRRVSRLLADSGHPNHAYVDYKELLDKEKDHLDAVIVATPDFWHAEHAIACMKAGLQVYCEKEMSNNLADARRMVQTARETGKLLQIGHQRRSNPRYQFCYQRIITETKLLGRMTAANGQWNRAKRDFATIPARYNIKPEILEKYGFSSMQQFLNWRWYRGLGGGPIVDLGSHQIDIFNWFLNARPTGVIASGGTDYLQQSHPPVVRHRDGGLSITITPTGVARAFYQTITTNGFGGYFEVFMGDQGALEISESAGRGSIYRDTANAPDWKSYVKDGILMAPKEEPKPAAPRPWCWMCARPRRRPATASRWRCARSITSRTWRTFSGRCAGRNKLNCPAEIGYETAVTVLKVNEAVEAQKRLEFKPEDFEI